MSFPKMEKGGYNAPNAGDRSMKIAAEQKRMTIFFALAISAVINEIFFITSLSKMQLLLF